MKRDSKYIISQKWSDLFFMNFKVDQEELRNLLPDYLKPDVFNGNCYTSIVPFEMSNIRFPLTPPLPFSELTELNLRTYVLYNDIPGIYFFTLDSNHVLGNWIANKFFNLPYRYSKIDHIKENESHLYNSSCLELKATVGLDSSKDELGYFLVERYSLFTDNGRFVYQGRVFHDPWKLNEVRDIRFTESLNNKYGVKSARFDSCFFSKRLDVYFRPFEKVGTL